MIPLRIMLYTIFLFIVCPALFIKFFSLSQTTIQFVNNTCSVASYDAKKMRKCILGQIRNDVIISVFYFSVIT